MAELKSTTLTAGGTFNAQDGATTNPQYSWTVYGNTGTERVTLNAYGGSVYGYGDNDTVTAVGNAMVYGGDGDDSILASGTNTIYGEAGADLLTLAANATGNTTFHGGEGIDEVRIVGSGNNTIYGDAGDDNISLYATASGANVIYGGAGLDKISIGAVAANVATTLSGGAGVDTYDLLATTNGLETIVLNAGDGADSVGSGFDLATDKLSFGFTAAQLAANIPTGIGGANIKWTIGSDSIELNKNIATAAALAGATNTAPGLITSSEGKNVVYASAATASTKAAAADAYVIGADANSVFEYNSTALKYYGSTGAADEIKAAATETSALTLDLTDTKFSAIEKATGGDGADILRGLTAATDVLVGGKGNDSIWGRGGADNLTGGAGADLFYVGIGDGADVIVDANATQGKDTIKLYNVAKSDITISADGTGTNTILTFTGGDSVTVNGGEATAAAYVADAVKYELSDGTVMRVGSITNFGNMVYDSTVGYYWGSKSSVLNYGVTAAAQTTGQTMNLYDTTKFNNIHVAFGSATAANTLRGTSGKDTLQGGTAADAFWGGAGGTDSMVLGVDNAADTVWFGKTDGDDTVTNADSSDKIKLWNVALSDIAGVTGAANLVMTFKNNAVDRLTLGAVAPTFELQDGTTFTVSTDGVYSSTAAFYAGGKALVDATAQSSAVLLDLGDTVKYATTYLNVTGGDGADTLRGNAGVNTIIGGKGADLIWGAAGVDSLKGGAGVDTFYWGTADGADVIADGEAGESVLLYTAGLTPSGLTATLAAGNMTIASTFAPASTLTIENFNSSLLNKFVFGYSSTADNTYKLVDAGSGNYSFEKITA